MVYCSDRMIESCDGGSIDISSHRVWRMKVDNECIPSGSLQKHMYLRISRCEILARVDRFNQVRHNDHHSPRGTSRAYHLLGN
jgi:hypothetical protein